MSIATCSKALSITIGGCLYRLTDYGGAQALFVPPVGADASADPEWNGSVNVYEPGPNQIYFQAPLGVDTNPAASIQSKKLHQAILDGPYTGQFYPPVTHISPADTFYRFEVSAKVGGSYAIVWVGYKVGGDLTTFVGTYISGETKIPSIYPPGTFSDPRASIVLQAC